MQTRNIKQLKQELKNNAAIIKCAQEFNIIGDPTRLKICYLLCRHKELTVGEIAEIIGVSISAVSHTLKKLQNAKIVERRRDFRHVYYQLKKKSSLAHIIKNRFIHIQ